LTVTIYSETQHELGEFSLALQSKQRAIDIGLKLFGEEHPSVAESYSELAIIQKAQGEDASARQSEQHALDIIQKLFGEEH